MKDFYLRLSVSPAYVSMGKGQMAWNSWCNGYRVVSEQEFRNQELVDVSENVGVGFCKDDSELEMSCLDDSAYQVGNYVAYIDGYDGNPVAIYVQVTEEALDTLNRLLKETDGKVYVAYTI